MNKLEFLTLREGRDGLSRKVGKELPLHFAEYLRREQILTKGCYVPLAYEHFVKFSSNFEFYFRNSMLSSLVIIKVFGVQAQSTEIHPTRTLRCPEVIQF
jgi:hypothetical protein